MKAYKTILAIVTYFFILFGIYYSHVAFFKVKVVFYSAIWDSILATLVIAVILYCIKWFRCFSSFEKTQIVVICILMGYIFAISVPTVIDRSLSFYILEKLQQQGAGIRIDKFEDVFTKEYVREYRLVDVRLTEQQESGTIAIIDNCVRLTSRGKRLAKFSRFFRQHFLPKQRLLMGKYTDDLTDPFRNREQTLGYECK